LKKAIILVSGGLDSATALAVAKNEGFECYALSFAYGQRHKVELAAAKHVVESIKCRDFKVINIDLSQWGGSALTSDDIEVPKNRSGNEMESDIPLTYVPARNMVFLSFAAAWAEVVGAKDIFIGVNSVDYSGYPDCRPEFISAFAKCAKLGTKAADEGWDFNIHAPLQKLDKAGIIKLGISLNVDYSLTHSCYDPSEDGRACGACDSCEIRRAGFAAAGIPDPTIYVG
jgi:7-cyano-7-deazaguanine synthase